MYLDFLHRLNSNPELAHAYNTLLSSLHLLNSTRPLKSLLVASTQPEEGKTTVTINLALAMTLAGARTVILDTDLHKPRVHDIFDLGNTRGFSDLISGSPGGLSFNQLGHMVDVQTDTAKGRSSIGVVTSGRGEMKPFTALAPSKLKEAIEYLALDFDVAVLDSPPVLATSDALVLAPLVDGIILVLDTGRVTERDVRCAKERLAEAGGHILGVAMNRFDERRHGPGFHPYQRYYSSGPTTDQ
jgi:capsular exopolysaccharide synthesis family protein